jgi:dTDP-4-amino-4,6-dideoxygalactose transaminase
MRFLRQQLPVYSPLSLRATAQAIPRALRLLPDRGPDLVTRIRQAYKASQIVLCGSGTQALQLALESAASLVGRASPVALPSYSCFDVATAAVGVDARILIYDIDPGTLSPDIDSLERALRHGARTVVVTPLFGLAIDWDAVVECADRYGGLVIEDAAQGHGAAWRGRRIGSLGEISVLSFGRGKGWTAGNGGALLVRGRPAVPELHANGPEPGPVAEIKLLAAVLAQWGLGRRSLYGLPAALPWLGLGETRYRDPTEPHRITRAATTILDHTWDRADREGEIRRANAGALLARISTREAVRPIAPHPDGEPGYLRLPVLLSHGLSGFPQPREAKQLGVASGYPSVLADLPQVRSRLESEGQVPGGRELVRCLVTLPTHSRCTRPERERLVRLLDAYLSD